MDRTILNNAPAPSPMPTMQVYIDLQMAFAYLNAGLFNFGLRHCLITLQRKTGAGGFFAGGRFNTRDRSEVVDEIALNPTYFAKQTDTDILAILAHEMCHLWQHHSGRRPRRAYHDQEWATKMVSIGLIPSDTGLPGGKQVGARMSHYVEPGLPVRYRGPRDPRKRHHRHVCRAHRQRSAEDPRQEARQQERVHLPGLPMEGLGQTGDPRALRRLR
jgi:predicted SprT family Zn-dependent metalloprotease